MNNVVDLAKTNENYKNVCGLSYPDSSWNCPAKDRIEKLTGSNFCWVHGFHNYADHGEYQITYHTNVGAMSQANGLVSTKDSITIRDHNNHEWNFDVAHGFQMAIIWMLCKHPAWLHFVLKHGLSHELTVHLADRFVIMHVAEIKQKRLEEIYNRLACNIHYKRDDITGKYAYNWETYQFLPRENLTEEQKLEQLNALEKFYDDEMQKIHNETQAEIEKLEVMVKHLRVVN